MWTTYVLTFLSASFLAGWIRSIQILNRTRKRLHLSEKKGAEMVKSFSIVLSSEASLAKHLSEDLYRTLCKRGSVGPYREWYSHYLHQYVNEATR